MSLLQWFSRPAPPMMPEAESSGLSRLDITRPFTHPAEPVPRAADDSVPLQKAQRMARRELLYAVVRESMIDAGVLSLNYRFKVMSMDSTGKQFMIMIDLVRSLSEDMSHLPALEAQIAQRAKARYGMLVKAVYWRVNETGAAAQIRRPVRAPAPPDGGVPWVVPDVPHAKSSSGKAWAAPASSPHEKNRMPGYEDTEALGGAEERTSTLGTTQYGDLV